MWACWWRIVLEEMGGTKGEATLVFLKQGAEKWGCRRMNFQWWGWWAGGCKLGRVFSFCCLYFLPHFVMEDLNIFWGESIRGRKKEKAKERLGSDGPKQPAKGAFIIKLPWPRHQGSWGGWWLPWLCGGSSETESFREKGRTCGEGEGLQREGRGCPQGNVPALV